MKRYIRFALIVPLVLLFTVCKSAPEPVEEEIVIEAEAPPLGGFLVFDRIEADDPNTLRLFFNLEAAIPAEIRGRGGIESWRVEINGIPALSGLNLEFPPEQEISGNISFPLKLHMDMATLAAAGIPPADDYEVKLTTGLHFAFEDLPPAELQIYGIGTFPRIQPPVFTITAIAILQAELINTRFRVGLRIDNPNPFPVELSAFSYDLYGNGRLWADGIYRDIIQVPANSSMGGNLFLLMNFIDMRRDLLDQIIELQDVSYRFIGEAQVGTELDYLPVFSTSFELSGYSQVLEN